MALVIFTQIILLTPLLKASEDGGGDFNKISLNEGVKVWFGFESSMQLSREEQQHVIQLVNKAEEGTRQLFSDLPKSIEISIAIIDREINQVGGVTGRATAPGKVLIEISRRYPGGVYLAINKAFLVTLYHELHHLMRGWTIQGNKFGRGIAIAAVNEGLAQVYAETLTGEALPASQYGAEIAQWYKEVIALPVNANYNHWMNEHLDGRQAVGYKVGKYIVERAMQNSKLSIVEMSKLSPKEVLALVE